MVIYVDLIFIINFIFDTALLLTVDLLLKRGVRYRRVILGALVGELSMVTLFFSFNSFENFVFKVVLSIMMCLAAFSYKDLKYTVMNTVYLYLVGMILGGFEYYLYNEFRMNSEYGLKYLIILFLSPIVLIVYYKFTMKLKNNYNNRHSLEIYYQEEYFKGVGYLDSGNRLLCPINGKKIILVEKEYIVHHKLKLIPVPYNALNHHGIVYCFTPKVVLVDGKKYDDVMIGLQEKSFNIDGVNALLNARMENL